ncbi:hypothetical protein CsSME_00037557 [Camellia sinensis var. sinensis]
MALQNGTLQLLFFIILFLETIKLSSCIENEKQALLKLKQGLTDPSSRLPSWVGENCCTWSGVTCNNKTRNVIGLNLRNPLTGHELGGKIDPSLLDLKYLHYLDLSMNNFGGIQIPTFFGSLTKLRYLNLSGAFFGGTIPPNLGNISNLLYLDLSSLFAELNGNDLKWTSSLSSLKYLNLGGVDLSKASSSWLQTYLAYPTMASTPQYPTGCLILVPLPNLISAPTISMVGCLEVWPIVIRLGIQSTDRFDSKLHRKYVLFGGIVPLQQSNGREHPTKSWAIEVIGCARAL